MKHLIINLIGAKASGKTTLAKELGFPIVITTTTRTPRKSETNNDYNFVSVEEYNKNEYIMYFNDLLAKKKKEFYAASIDDISQSVGVGNYKKYVIDDEDNFMLGKQCPVSVQAIARFNYLAHKNGEDNKKTYSGKIKYYNITIGTNAKTAIHGYFGFPSGELPSWAPRMDKRIQWEKNVIDPINRFLEVMKIPLASSSNVIQQTLFNF